MADVKIVARPWQPQDLIDDLQDLIDEECDNYLNTRRTTLCMARDYLKEYFAKDNNVPINDVPDTNVGKWIPVTERLPEEHESIFAKIYGTNRWEPAMSCMVSDDVLAVVKFEDGTRKVKTARTTDGEWRLFNILKAKEVTHWMPMPEPPKGE